MKLPENLQRICRERKISVTELARKSKVPQPTIHGWVTGRKVQNIDDLKKVCDVLEVSLHFLLYNQPDPYEVPSEEILKELFRGDIRVTIQKIERLK